MSLTTATASAMAVWDQDDSEDDYMRHMTSGRNFIKVCLPEVKRKKPKNQSKRRPLIPLTGEDSDLDGSEEDHNYCSSSSMGPLLGFNQTDTMAAVIRCFDCFDNDFNVGQETGFSSDEEMDNIFMKHSIPFERNAPLIKFTSKDNILEVHLTAIELNDLVNQKINNSKLAIEQTTLPNLPVTPPVEHTTVVHNKMLQYTNLQWDDEPTVYPRKLDSRCRKNNDDDLDGSSGSGSGSGGENENNCDDEDDNAVTDFYDTDGCDLDVDDSSDSDVNDFHLATQSSQERRDKGETLLVGDEVSIERNNGISTYGHIPGIPVGKMWQYRSDMCHSGIHCPRKAFVHCGEDGAYSLLLCGLFAAKDEGNEFVYNGETPRAITRRRKKSTGPALLTNQKRDQELRHGNMALYLNMWSTNPVRVIRCSSMKSIYAPSDKNHPYRYDGLFKVTSFWRERQYDGIWEYRFHLSQPLNERPTLPAMINSGELKGTLSEFFAALTPEMKWKLKSSTSRKTVSVIKLPETFLPRELKPVYKCHRSARIPPMCLTAVNGRVPVVKLDRLSARHFIHGFEKKNIPKEMYEEKKTPHKRYNVSDVCIKELLRSGMTDVNYNGNEEGRDVFNGSLRRAANRKNDHLPIINFEDLCFDAEERKMKNGKRQPQKVASVQAQKTSRSIRTRGSEPPDRHIRDDSSNKKSLHRFKRKRIQSDRDTSSDSDEDWNCSKMIAVTLKNCAPHSVSNKKPRRSKKNIKYDQYI